jgi:hypothetical protein
MQLPSVAVFFVALAVIFLGVAFRDYLKAEGKLVSPRQTWIYISFVFSALAILLHFVLMLL